MSLRKKLSLSIVVANDPAKSAEEAPPKEFKTVSPPSSASTSSSSGTPIEEPSMLSAQTSGLEPITELTENLFTYQHRYQLPKETFAADTTDLHIAIGLSQIDFVFPPRALEGQVPEHIFNSAAFQALYDQKNLVEMAKNWLHAAGTEISLSIEETASGKVRITLQDNGHGFNTDFIKDAEADTEISYGKFLVDKETGIMGHSVSSKKATAVGESYGGAGMGMANLFRSLQKAGGDLLIANVSDDPKHPGKLRGSAITLVSPVGPRLEQQLHSANSPEQDLWPKIKKGSAGSSPFFSPLSSPTEESKQGPSIITSPKKRKNDGDSPGKISSPKLK